MNALNFRTARNLLAGLFLCAAALSHAAPTFSRMVVMGDSLSDTGNIRNVLGSSALISVPAGYGANGRFSNGILWHEYLAPQIGVPVATASRVAGANNTNFAYGGARIDGAGTPQAGMLTQYSQYNARFTSGADANALYVLWGGGNDMRDLVGNASPLTAIATSLNNLEFMLDGLIGSGATSFMVPNLPDLGKIPENRGSSREASASAVSRLWNAALYDMVLSKAGLASFYFLDVFDIFTDLLDHPVDYGFTNTTGTCRIVTFVIFESACAAAATTVFWDGIHPTTAAHRVLGNAAAALLRDGSPLAVVSTPGSLALVALALAAAGVVTRRRLAA